MAYRKIREEELVRGTVVRTFGGIEADYNSATITMVRDGEVHLCRPFVYANEHFDSRTGLVGVENYSIEVKRALEHLEVFVGSKDVANVMVT